MWRLIDPLAVAGRRHRLDPRDRLGRLGEAALREHRVREVDVDERLVPAVAGPGDDRLGVADRALRRRRVAGQRLGDRVEQREVGGDHAELQLGEPGAGLAPCRAASS